MNMASITGTSSSSILTSLSNGRISGLASGMDTDALVESMTATTRSKIAKIQQQKQLASWKMDAFRSISSKMIALQSKFTSYSSSTNLRSPSFFSKSQITASGEYSKYVKATGNGDNAGSVSVVGVAQLAQKASYISAGSVSDGKLQGSAITAGDATQISKLAGETIKFEYNNKSFSITLDSAGEYNTVDDVVNEINKQLKNQEYSGNTDYANLSEIVKAEVVDGNLTFSYVSDSVKAIGNTFEITSIGSDMTDVFGISEGDKITGDTIIKGTKQVDDAAIKAQLEEKDNADLLAEKSFTFSYNGKTATIKLGKAEELKDENGNFSMKKVQEQLQKQLDKEFGSGRVTVKLDEKEVDVLDASGNAVKDENGNPVKTTQYNLSFQTTIPGANGTRTEDTTSVLKITGGDTGALKALGLREGASNRLNTGVALKDAGFANLGSTTDYSISIKNNVTDEIITIDKTVDGKTFDENTTMKEIMEAINASDAGVQVTYLDTADKFSLVSTEEGASGNFSIVTSTREVKDENGNTTTEATGGLGVAIFGDTSTAEGKAKYNITEGQDAEIWVDYDGKGGSEPIKVTRSSNAFDLNGMNVTVSGTFNVNDDGTPVDNAEAVTFDAKVDTEKITEAVKEMITAYNEVIELANKLVAEKRDRDYQPLTDEQKEEMSEDEIKKWEEKAQKGMLFNNTELRAFTGEVRFLFSKTADMVNDLKEMGITTATSYSGAGKVNFDENAFKAALESNPEKVKDMFTALEESTTDENGNKVVTKQGGLMSSIKTVFDKYSATDTATKGVFVQLAGATESPLSMLNNSIQKQMDSYDDMIEKLQDKLEDEAERYYRQFSNMEVYINNMNSQSSWLSQQFAY